MTGGVKGLEAVRVGGLLTDVKSWVEFSRTTEDRTERQISGAAGQSS